VIQVAKKINEVLAERTDLNQAKLARLSRIGKARLGRIVHQQASPSMAELERIAYALGVKPSYLIEEEIVPCEKRPDPELIQLLDDPTLALSLRALGELDDDDKKAIARVIQRFAEKSA
jgi:transcriptional regulator with XRE-family HTH domain